MLLYDQLLKQNLSGRGCNWSVRVEYTLLIRIRHLVTFIPL